MRSRILAPFVPAAIVLAAAACAPHRHAPEPLDPDFRDFGALANPGAEAIPLFSERTLPGCPYRTAGEMAAPSLTGLRDQAHQLMADAVVSVRRHVEPTPRLRSAGTGGTVRPAVVEYYTGLAVRFTPACGRGQGGAAPPQAQGAGV